MAGALKLGNFIKQVKLAELARAELAEAELAEAELVEGPKLGVDIGLGAGASPRVAGVFGNTLPACLALARSLSCLTVVFACWQLRALARLRQLRSRPRRCQLHSRSRHPEPRRKCKSLHRTRS